MDASINPTYPLFPVFAFVGFFLVLILLPWHIQAWNLGTCAFIFWVSISCLLEFVNSVVWRNTTENLVPVWCDISSKIILGASVGIPAAGLCISRRLYIISAIKSTVITRQDKRRAVIIDSCIAFGLPILVMALHYIVQGHRFDILEDVGCFPAIYDSLISYFLVYMWPILLGCVSFVFSALTLRAFYKRQLEFTQLLSTHSSLSMSRYVRLMMLAVSEMLCTIPASVLSAYFANQGVPMQPWVSWDYVHYHFSYVGQIPASEWLSIPSFRVSVELTRWLFPASALLFFLLFGLGAEARKHYRAAFLRVAKCFGYTYASDMDIPVHVPRSRVKQDSTKISVGSLPVYVPRNMPSSQDTDALMVPGGKCFDIDVEKTAGSLSPSVSSCSQTPQDRMTPSPMATNSAGDIDDCEDGAMVDSDLAPMPASPGVHPHTIPAYHRPFSLPSIYPTPHHEVQGRLLDNVYITVQQTQYGTAV